MHWTKIAITVLALLLGGWLLFDGSRALVTGDYTTQGTGAYAGELGPWADLVSAMGIEPRSTGMKAAHVVLGIGLLASAFVYARQPNRGRTAILVSAIASLWYLPFGTLLGVLLLVLLFINRPRPQDGGLEG